MSSPTGDPPQVVTSGPGDDHQTKATTPSGGSPTAAPPAHHHLDPNLLHPPTGLKAFWGRRGSIFATSTQQMSLSHYLTNEVVPHLDHYRMSVVLGMGKTRPTLDDLLYDDLNRNQQGVAADVEEGVVDSQKGKIKFTWLEGVLMRCLLNIWGVMLFLRLTWVIGQAGLIQGLLVIAICNVVTIITALSMSAVCTNGQIKAGGIYYLISRSLGPELGGSIGLMFTLANSIAVSMYLIGFCESLLDMLKQYVDGFESIIHFGKINDIRLISCVTLVLILGLAIVGMEWVTRVQMGLLVLLVASQVDFIIGTFMPTTLDQNAKGFVGYSSEVVQENLFSAYTYDEDLGKTHDFFSVFAVFFPAVTGIVAGANLSGDLKDPSTAIPKGTLLAILITAITYLVYGAMSGSCSLRYASGSVEEYMFAKGMLNESTIEELNVTRAFNDCDDRECAYGLIQSQQMMEVMSAWGPLIYAGCFAATLSSAIASLVGAPRVFQAVSKDKIFPLIYFFSEGYGANNDPVRGYCLVFVIAVICILIGNLNQVSTLLSNFFVAAYALINFSVFHASITKSPGWRPTFKYYNKWLSFIGTLLCIAVMFLMDYRTALATYIIIMLLYACIRVRKPEANWGSSAQSLQFLQALKSVHTVAKVDDHVKTYRPKILLLSGEPADRPCLVDFANLITKHLSLLECVNIVPENMDWKAREATKTRGQKYIRENKIKAFYTFAQHHDFYEGAKLSMELSGLGKLCPNMLMIGFQENWWSNSRDCSEYYRVLQSAFDLRMSVGVLRIQGGLDISKIGPKPISSDLNRGSSNMSSYSRSSSNMSVDSGLEDPKFFSSTMELKPSMEEVKKSWFRRMPKKKPKEAAVSASRTVLMRRDGEVISNEQIVKTMTQFRSSAPMDGYIDVYWLYDDGGLTLLIPHILKMKAKFEKCKLRVFFLSSKLDSLDEEARTMAALLNKFRIPFQDVILLSDATKHPEKRTREDFKDLIYSSSRSASSEGVASNMNEDVCNIGLVPESDLIKHKEKTHFHLRISEIVRENSKKASLVVMTLPLPKRDIPAALYMAWMDFMSQNLPPFLFLRGNQESVLTFYS